MRPRLTAAPFQIIFSKMATPCDTLLLQNSDQFALNYRPEVVTSG